MNEQWFEKYGSTYFNEYALKKFEENYGTLLVIIIYYDICKYYSILYYAIITAVYSKWYMTNLIRELVVYILPILGS